MTELRVGRGFLTNTQLAVFGAGVTDLIPLPSVRQIYLLRFIDIHVTLPSLTPYVYVADGSLDLNEQDRQRRLAFTSTPGNAIEVSIGSFTLPLTYPLKNVSGGYKFNLKPLFGDAVDDYVLLSSETLNLKLTAPLGTGDVVGFSVTGFVRIDDETG